MSGTSRAGIWLYALRAPFLTASGIPVLLGAFAAFGRTGDLDPAKLALTVGAVLCVHLGANLANDYFDELTGCDPLNPEPTPFSGGSRVIEQGLIPGSHILAASAGFFALALVQGIWLNHIIPGNLVLWLGVAGILCGVLYTALPFKLSYRGVGEVVIFIAFGPLAVMGGYLCQTGRLEAYPLAVSVPAGLFVLAILLVNEVLDVKWDGRAGKRTVVVRIGKRRGYMLYLAAYVAANVWIALGLIVRIYPLLAVAAFIPMAVFGRRLLPGKALSERGATINASRLTILTHTIATSLLAVSYLVPH
jgi:1,4-dihydroxy-2-naphthoate octaprenyltransferase